MALVLDFSITAVWGLADESSPLADLAAKRLESEIALVPLLWWYEVRNLHIVSERRKHISAAESGMFLELLSSYPIQVDFVQDDAATLALARRHQLSFYDASYLSVAQRNAIPLATLDRGLSSAAISAGVALLA